MAGEVNDIPTKRVAGKNTLQEDGQAPARWSPSGHCLISPRENITRQDSQEVTTAGLTVARRSPGEVVTEEHPIMPTLVPQDDAANAHASADYFFPKDHPGHKGVTAIAVRDRETKFLAGHVVDQKGAGEDRAVKQLLKDLRKMGRQDCDPDRSRSFNH